jgi:hypothetical protein
MAFTTNAKGLAFELNTKKNYLELEWDEKLRKQREEDANYKNLLNLFHFLNQFYNSSQDEKKQLILSSVQQPSQEILKIQDETERNRQILLDGINALEKSYLLFISNFKNYQHDEDIVSTFINTWGFFNNYISFLDLKQSNVDFDQLNNIQNTISETVITTYKDSILFKQNLKFTNDDEFLKLLSIMKYTDQEEYIQEIKNLIDDINIPELIKVLEIKNL